MSPSRAPWAAAELKVWESVDDRGLRAFWAEIPVARLAAEPVNNPAVAELYLNTNGLGAFDYIGNSGCDQALLFTHPSASSAPILDAVATMADAETPYFWTFLLGGDALGSVVDANYVFSGSDLPSQSELESIFDDLGISATLVGSEGTIYYVASEARSGLEVVDQINRLHEQLGDEVAFWFGGVGCPSGGGGGGGPLDPLEVPVLDWRGLTFFAWLLAIAALGIRRRNRTRPLRPTR